MKKKLLLAALPFAMGISLLAMPSVAQEELAYADEIEGGGPQVSCAAAAQICYKVYLGDVMVKSVKGVAKIEL